MTVLTEPGSLEDAPQYDDWVDPKTMSDEQNEAISASLEALFALPGEEKLDYPHELSALIRSVFGTNRTAYAINAGDGSIFSAFDPAFCFGIEPEEKRSRKRKGRYQSVVGDLNKLSGLFEPIDRELDDTIVIVRKPSDIEDIKEFLNVNLSSQVYTVWITSHDVTGTEPIPGVYAVLETEENRIFFCTDPDRLKEERPEIVVRKATLDMVDLLGPWLEEQRGFHARPFYSRYENTRYAKQIADDWKSIHREYGRRFLREEKTYDIGLVGKKVLQYEPSDWVKDAIQANSNLGDLNARIHKREIGYFAQNSGLWRELMILEDEGIILIDPLVHEAVEPIIEDAERITTPLRPLKTAERLGYLHRQSKIKCIKDDEDRDLKAGKWYSVELRQEEYAKNFSKTENVKGVLQLVRKKRRYYHQRIIIDGRHSFYDDDAENVKYFLKYFDLPDPGDLRTRYPEQIAKADKIITEIQKDYLTPRGLSFKEYQAKDMAALSVNNRGILAHQQGLGKTPQGLAFALAAQKKTGKNLPVLVICPQDLIPQWQAEAKKFYGIDLKWIGRHKGNKTGSREVKNGDDTANITSGAIQNLIEARNINKAIREGAGGFYITHFEALTMGGSKNLRKIEEPYVIRIEKEQEWIAGHYTTDPDTGRRTWHNGEYQEKEIEITSAQECPECGKSLNGRMFCTALINAEHGGRRRCGWTRYTYRLPSIGKILATTFRNGVIVVDEGTQIASARNSNENDSSQKTKAVCGMRASHRLVMSGTPVKNFIAQAFWLLWWGIGNKSERFNYAYSGGKAEFAKDYTVMEWTYNEDSGQWHKQKEVGEVTNHTKLWAQLSSILLRRLKDETGELIVKKKDHVLYAPLGYYQREQMDYWISHFPDLFAEKYPQDPKVKRGSHRSMAALLGLDHKLNYASVMPKSDPDYAWTNVAVSNFTPAAYQALTTIMALVKQGRRVLVGTDVKKATPWLAARLNEKGVTSRTMLKGNGTGETLDPADRSKVIEEFQTGAMAVLCSTQKAIRLGHNLDQGSAVVLLGLDWDYETYAQFTERVHRLTSVNPVDVYIVIPGERDMSLVGRKWDRITDKAKGASMAIDGVLPEQNEDPPDIAAIVKEMVEKGFPATGKEVRESAVAEAWAKVPQIGEFTIPEGFAIEQAQPWVIDWDAANAAYEERLAIEAEYEAEQQLDPADIREFMAECQAAVDRGIGEALEAFFAGATAPLVVEEIVATATISSDPPVAPKTTETREELRSSSDGDAIAVIPVEEDGQLTLTTEPEVVPPTAPAPSLDVMGQIKQAAELHELGILTDEEFAETKTALIALLKAAA